MFDSLYTQMTKLANYKILLVIPPLLTIMLGFFAFQNGVPLGMDFKGGTWMDIITDVNLDAQLVSSLEQDLLMAGLEEPEVRVGRDIESGKNKVSVATASVVDKALMYGIIARYVPDLRDEDVATVALSEEPPGWLEFKLSSRLNEYVGLNYSDGILKITALYLDEEEIESVLKYHLGGDYDVTVEKKNFNLREVGPKLGETFREQGVKAIFLSFLLMAFVVFIAFKDLIPSIAVLQAAFCDVILAVGGMSIFNIPVDSASLGALLMLIGYSVDTDILLTVRMLKEKTVEIDDGINKAMKTGLMMTSTIVVAMIVTIMVTTFLIQIPTLNSIATVLMFGLIADLFTTWWTNAGLLKWHLSRPKKPRKKLKFKIFKE